MKIYAIGLLSFDHSLWADYCKEMLEQFDDFLVFQFGNCEESAKVCWENGATIVDEPIDYLGCSDLGTALTTMHEQARKDGADAVFMADPQDKWIGKREEAERLLLTSEVIKSRLFRARVTEQDEEATTFQRRWFEPEYNHKVQFVQCNPGRLYWGMYPFWPYGALSCTEYGLVKSYALAHSKDAYRVVTLGTGNYEEQVGEVFKRAEDWVARDMKSAEGNPLITEDQFDTKGVELARAI